MKFDHRFRLEEAGPSMCICVADGIRMRLDFFSHVLRAALIREGTPLLPTWSVCPGGYKMPLEGRPRLSSEGFTPVSAEFSENADTLSFRFPDLDFLIEKKNFRITVKNQQGILYRDRSGLAYNFDGELGRGSVHFTDRFPGQRIYGLGDKCGPVDKSGHSYQLSTTDNMGFRCDLSDPLYKQVPFYICEHAAGSYGLFYDTCSRGSMNFGAEHDNYFEPFNAARFDEENLVFYLIFGSPKEIVQRFTALCGGAAETPEWAFRYCGSTMEYTDAPDSDQRLRGFLTKCGEYGIHPGGFYLSSGYTQIGESRCVFHWNRDKIPSPEDLAAHFENQDVHLIPNVKPAFLTVHPLYEKIARQGWFLHYADGTPACFPFWGGMASYLDFTNRGAYDFWKEQVRSVLVSKGCRHIWNDNNEYDVQDEDVMAAGFGQSVPAVRIGPLFSYLMARASREACLEAGVETPFNISRCAMAGTQRVASTWTGDNYTDFGELRGNHRQAMTMSLSGFQFFGPDIGGFAGPQPDRELFLRWLQYGLFLPRFTLHSWKPGEESTMPWLYPDVMPAVQRFFRLREDLVPALYAQAEISRKRDLPLIRPVFLEDPAYDRESDFFLCGENFLVCPVFDRGVPDITVTLPEIGKGWRLRGAGEILENRKTVCIPCLPTDLPVWFVKVIW